MSALKRLNEFLMTVGSWGTILFMTVMAIVVPYEVVGRYVFQSMTTWSGEVAIYSLAWASMLGAAAGLKKGYQIRMTFVADIMPPVDGQGPVSGGLSVHPLLFRGHVLLRDVPDHL